MQKPEAPRTNPSRSMRTFPFHSQPLLPSLPTVPSRGLAALAEAIDALIDLRRDTAAHAPSGPIPFGSCPAFHPADTAETFPGSVAASA